MKHYPAQIRLPRPPSTNGLFATNFKTKRRFKSKGYADWINEATMALAEQDTVSFLGWVNIKISVGKPTKRKEDISNRCKALEDFLVDQGVIQDDSFISCLTIWWDFGGMDCVVSIEAAKEIER